MEAGADAGGQVPMSDAGRFSCLSDGRVKRCLALSMFERRKKLSRLEEAYDARMRFRVHLRLHVRFRVRLLVRLRVRFCVHFDVRLRVRFREHMTLNCADMAAE